MWHQFNIRTQLVIFMLIIVVSIEAATMFFTLKIQNEESRKNAVIEAEAITQSLHNDLLKYLLNPNADTLADITYRLSAFKKIKGVIIFNSENTPIYKNGNIEILLQKNISSMKENILFTDKHLLIKSPIIVDGYPFGYKIMDVDLSSFKQNQETIKNTMIIIFIAELLFGLVLSYYLSKSYTRPFISLNRAMRESDPTNDQITILETDANNEIKELFNGFNTQMEQIQKSTKKLQFQAKHDQLTNAYNRFYIEEQITNALQDPDNGGYNILSIDLDQFKLINNAVGFSGGDALLKMVVSELTQHLPKNAILARVDGDNFMIFMKNSTKEKGVKFLEETLERLKDFRFSWKHETFSVSASMALIYFEAFQYTLTEAAQALITSLEHAKSCGRNKYQIYDPSDTTTNRFITEKTTAKMINEALANGPARFELFAQDIVPLQYESDKIGYEILIRMWDKDNNFISPADFLPAAERYQLMSDIDIYVLWTYLESVTKNKDHIEKLHTAHINLAGSTLNNPDFQEKLKIAIETFDFPWEKLELEVTESSAIGSFNQANEFIEWVKSKNIGIALDDFGTGMASFEYLKSLPFDVVKIDGSFVKDMHTDPTDKAVIKYIQEIAELKGQETVAEYVETKEDVEALREIGITYGQGYYLGKPRSLSSWLKA